MDKEETPVPSRRAGKKRRSSGVSTRSSTNLENRSTSDSGATQASRVPSITSPGDTDAHRSSVPTSITSSERHSDSKFRALSTSLDCTDMSSTSSGGNLVGNLFTTPESTSNKCTSSPFSTSPSRNTGNPIVGSDGCTASFSGSERTFPSLNDVLHGDENERDSSASSCSSMTGDAEFSATSLMNSNSWAAHPCCSDASSLREPTKGQAIFRPSGNIEPALTYRMSISLQVELLLPRPAYPTILEFVRERRRPSIGMGATRKDSFEWVCEFCGKNLGTVPTFGQYPGAECELEYCCERLQEFVENVSRQIATMEEEAERKTLFIDINVARDNVARDSKNDLFGMQKQNAVKGKAWKSKLPLIKAMMEELRLDRKKERQKQASDQTRKEGRKMEKVRMQKDWQTEEIDLERKDAWKKENGLRKKESQEAEERQKRRYSSLEEEGNKNLWSSLLQKADEISQQSCKSRVGRAESTRAFGGGKNPTKPVQTEKKPFDSDSDATGKPTECYLYAACCQPESPDNAVALEPKKPSVEGLRRSRGTITKILHTIKKCCDDHDGDDVHDDDEDGNDEDDDDAPAAPAAPMASAQGSRRTSQSPRLCSLVEHRLTPYCLFEGDAPIASAEGSRRTSKTPKRCRLGEHRLTTQCFFTEDSRMASEEGSRRPSKSPRLSSLVRHALKLNGLFNSPKLKEQIYLAGHTFMTILPDGTGNVYYSSGNLAILIYRTPEDLCSYIVLEDKDSCPLVLACFSRSGLGFCHYPDGKVRLTYNQVHGYHLGREGSIKQRWAWKKDDRSETFHPICFGINRQMGIRIMDPDHMTLSSNEKRHFCRFNVSIKVRKEHRSEQRTPNEANYYATFLQLARTHIHDLLRTFDALARSANPDKVHLPAILPKPRLSQAGDWRLKQVKD